jgi:hypothetical protein
VHVVSTRPSRNFYVSRDPGSPYRQEDFEVLTTVLSVLEWRRHNGPVRLYTDDAGRDFYAGLGLLGLWDGGVDASLLDQVADGINCAVFWSFGKVVALRDVPAPCWVLDTDLIVWGAVRRLVTAPVMGLHEEPLGFPAYVGRSSLVAPPGFDWDGLDWSVTPCSAALWYFADDGFKNSYAERALSFMAGNPVRAEADGGVPAHPVFVEQRLLPMCARRAGVRADTFLQDYRGAQLRSGERNTVFTHLWNAKSMLHGDAGRRRELCFRFARRIRRDHPQAAAILRESALVADYFRD